MILLQGIRTHIREHPVRTLSTSFGTLLTVQLFMDETAYTRLSIALIFAAFAFKTWVNFVFAVTTHRQRGETTLSRALERYFWALLGQSGIFTLLFVVAFLDLVGVTVWGSDLTIVRNLIRTFAVVSVVSVTIYGDQTLEELKDHFIHERERQLSEAG